MTETSCSFKIQEERTN